MRTKEGKRPTSKAFASGWPNPPEDGFAVANVQRPMFKWEG